MANEAPSPGSTWSQSIKANLSPSGLLKFLGLDWSREPPMSSHADPNPASFTDRPIRPLPKRRLRARLSHEQADSIMLPPAPLSSSPVFGSPIQNHRAVASNSFLYASEAQVPISDSKRQGHTQAGRDEQSELDSEDDHEEGSISRQRSSWSTTAMRNSRSAAHYSAASSGDGYESFENTNNKKKRKIPQHQNGLSYQPSEDQDAGLSMGPGAYQLDGAGYDDYSHSNGAVALPGSAPGASRTGQATPGRTPAKAPKERQPLSAAPNAVNTPASNAQIRSSQNVPGSTPSDAPPTASNSARKVQQPKNSSKPPKQENQSYDFTFERQSQSSDMMSQVPKPAMTMPQPQYVGNIRDVAAQGTQTGNPLPVNGQRAQPPPAQQHSRAPAGQAPPPEQPPPPSRTEQYRIAAGDRRRSQRAVNDRQLRERKDVTLCEFCEFKAIWLYTPRFLIRRYEERDLKRRQDIENRRRLLEKAKAKSRKTKKGTKGQKNASSQQQPQDPNQPPYDPAYDDGIAPEDAQSPGEEYFDDDEYYDENGAHPSDHGDDIYGEYPPPLEPIPNPNAGNGYGNSGPPHSTPRR